MRKLTLSLLILVATSTFAEGARLLPADNLNYPVYIRLANGSTGSGFFVNSATGTFLVTAKHVLFNENCATPLAETFVATAYPLDPSEAGRNVLNVNMPVLIADGNVKCDSARDVAVLRIGHASGSESVRQLVGVRGMTVSEASRSGLVGIGRSAIRKFDQVFVSNEVYIFGYPTSLGLRQIPQLDYDRPLLRKGIIAGTNRSQKTLILDCPSYPGNSGGPVIELADAYGQRDFYAVGVVTQFIPWVSAQQGSPIIANSGYSVAASMDGVLELIDALERRPPN